MIPVAKVPAPKGYALVKQRGETWRRANPQAKRPKDFWSAHLQYLDDGFAHLCGYAAMLDPTGGTVDHYLSWKSRPDLAYEWSNFRFVSGVLNSSKRTADDSVLDPYLVGKGWFEILLPSLQLQLTDKVPKAQRAKAQHTLNRLKLGDGEKIVRWRQRYYERYVAGQLDLEGLRTFAPLVAEAVERQLSSQPVGAKRPAKRAMKAPVPRSGRSRKPAKPKQK
jgi:hypothetical protein